MPPLLHASVGSLCCQVHAYTACPNNQTAYLAELKSGKEVLVVDAEGQQRSAIIGRVKIETRPLVSSLPVPWLLSAIPGCMCKHCISVSQSCKSNMLQYAPASTPTMPLTEAHLATQCSSCVCNIHWHSPSGSIAERVACSKSGMANFCASRY